MPIPRRYLATFCENEIYHIYNRTNNKEAMFLNDGNRLFFLQNYATRLSGFLTTFVWTLLNNHFHLLVRVNDHQSIREHLKRQDRKSLAASEKKFLAGEIPVDELIADLFKRFFQSYSLSFNQVHSRSGNLFQKPFRRVLISKESQFTMAIVYIHVNAMKHGLVKDLDSHPWSSWHTILSKMPTQLARQEVLDWFRGREAFIRTHRQLGKNYDDSFSMEDWPS